jgi:hypothetical protein
VSELGDGWDLAESKPGRASETVELMKKMIRKILQHRDNKENEDCDEAGCFREATERKERWVQILRKTTVKVQTFLRVKQQRQSKVPSSVPRPTSI